jgi:MgtE intracellular N domain
MEMRIMTDLGVRNAAAEADAMVNPASLAASMIEERAPDIVEALNDMPPELAIAVLLHLPPDRAIEVLDQPELEREPELVTLMPREAAAKLLAGVSADVSPTSSTMSKNHTAPNFSICWTPTLGSTSDACWNIRKTPRDRS